MKARQIQSRFWSDEFVSESTWQSRYVFMYLCTCSSMNICGVFQSPDRKILFETGLEQDDLDIAKEELEKNKKVFFHKGWVYVVNAFKNFKVWKSPSNWDSWQEEWNQVNDSFKEYIDTGVGTGVYTGQKQEIENRKLEIGVITKNKMLSGKETDKIIESIGEI